MPNSQLYTAVSFPRYKRYLEACGNDNEKAMCLYKGNIALSQQLYGVIGIFEVIFRNSIDRHFISKKGKNWLEDAVGDGGYLEASAGCEDSFHAVWEAIQVLGNDYTHDRLITKLTFGFWRYQFGKKQFAAAGSSLLEIFPNRKFGTSQKNVFVDLTKINETRNRIAHYEPICFNDSNISTDRILRRYNLIIKLFIWMGCDPNIILSGIDDVLSAIDTINKIQLSIGIKEKGLTTGQPF